MDSEIDPLTHDYSGATLQTLQNAVYIRLTTPKGSWWADAQLGSLLHLLHREKALPRIGLLAEQYAQEALQPLLDDGRASQITITHLPYSNGRLVLQIQVCDHRGVQFEFKHPVKLI